MRVLQTMQLMPAAVGPAIFATACPAAFAIVIVASPVP